MYGFPTGEELKDLIIRLYAKEGPALNGHREAMGLDIFHVKEFCADLSQSGHSSVDAFLEYRKEYSKIGKTAIAEVLIPFEDESKLFSVDRNWYKYLLGKLNAPPDQFHSNKLTIVTFNYDRSFEWYLFKTLSARFGLNEVDALELVGRIPVIHLYGTLGGLPWESNGRPYNSRKERPDIYLARDKIRIIYEDVSEVQEFNQAHEAFRSAERVVFLGFGYNKVNIQRLERGKWRRSNQFFQSSAFGITDLEKTGIKRMFDREIDFGNSDWDILKFLREKVDFEER